MARKMLTDEEVERKIKVLVSDPDVKLARREEYLRSRRRQYLYRLRSLKNHGTELRESGIDEATLEDMYREE